MPFGRRDKHKHKEKEAHTHERGEVTELTDENPSNHLSAIERMSNAIRNLAEKKELPDSNESTLPSDEYLKRYYARFGRNLTEMDIQIILFRYLKSSQFRVDDALKHFLKTAEFRRKQNVDYMAVFTSLIPLQGYNEAAICEQLGLPLVKVSSDGNTMSQIMCREPTESPVMTPTDNFYTTNYSDYYENGTEQKSEKAPVRNQKVQEDVANATTLERDEALHSSQHVHKLKVKGDRRKSGDRWLLARLKDKVFPHGILFKKESSDDDDASVESQGKDSESPTVRSPSNALQSLTLIPEDNEADLESSMLLDTTAAARPITDGATLTMDTESLNFHSLLEPIARTFLARVPSTFHYWDKEGHPVLYVRLHALSSRRFAKELFQLAPLGTDIKALISLFSVYTVEIMLQLIRFNNLKNMGQNVVREAFISEKMEKEQRILPKKSLITSSVVVVDCKGLRIKRFIYKPLVTRVISVIMMVQRHYPETLRHIYIVNCHPLFTFTYMSIRKAIQESTREKISFCTKSKTAETLKKAIDSELLPEEYGGYCHCMGGCCHVVYHPEADSETSETSSIPSEFDSSMPAASMNQSRSVRPGQMKTTVRLLHVSPKKHRSFSFAMHEHEELIWEFTVRKKRPIDFTVLFVPADGSEIIHVYNDVEMRDGASHYICPSIGTVLLKWTNRRNKLHTTHIHAKIYHEGNEI
ncbi:hypothetical protein STCU_06232 [Strigomonas culicis]|uniref:CRAL-TRIO domain-containing protein n=1 Tax=Strigomonas culicis TaxID=28005 RepID=S9U671_9TRYP|nr:hypothetical protein STCU_06232 [Strigomonas culicis]|eukprot:EPY26277.1 hypothetical protein STCU_06232 [Strigomonas culicis]